MSSSTTKNIRPGKPDDYKEVAPLIVQAMEDLACTFANTNDPNLAFPLFEYFFQQPKNQYSFKHTLVYEEDGKIAGSVISYEGALLPQYRKPFLDYIAEKYNVKDLTIEDETMDGEIYLDTISVSPSFQGRGIGTKLLKAIIEKSRSEGHKKLGLLVDLENPNAKKLYEALGFKSVGKKQLGDGVYEHLQLAL